MITPMMPPTVFAAYTWPMLFSPSGEPSSVTVMSGSVIPAMKVAGSMTSRQMRAEVRLKMTQPPSERCTAPSIHAMKSKLAL